MFNGRAIRTRIGERLRRHLLHNSATMNLERDFADAKLRRRLLVQKAARKYGLETRRKG
jgi:hypothetical protein